jgi:hypothetical protein
VPVIRAVGHPAPRARFRPRADRISKAYGRGDARVAALDQVPVSLERGRFTAVMGPSGGVVFGVAIQRAISDKGLDVLSVPMPTPAAYIMLSAVIGARGAGPSPSVTWRTSHLMRLVQ